uniref:Endothelial cells scavenger receptor n=1 Tax=Magallana gigas TaxID=29159 RepID=K1RBD9_MAGGI
MKVLWSYIWFSKHYGNRDGASMCGVFCAVFNSIQQITMDDNIDVFTTVRQLQTMRQDLCATQAVRYLQGFERKANATRCDIKARLLTIVSFLIHHVKEFAIASPTMVSICLRAHVNAAMAVDGRKTDLSFRGGQCTASAHERHVAQWHVDLGAVLGIDHITIYYRTDNVPWGFSVYISNTPEKEDGVLCFNDYYFTNETITPVITMYCTHHGRYVIYYNNRTSSSIPPYYSKYAYNELCEFEVYVCQNNTYGAGCSEDCGHCFSGQQCNHIFGTCPIGCDAGYYNDRCKTECPDGLYGINCLQICNANCYFKTCDKITGACQLECAVGWKPPLCNEECDDGTFGTNCSNVCGHCHFGNPCDKKTGECPRECDPGYEGLYCNQWAI